MGSEMRSRFGACVLFAILAGGCTTTVARPGFADTVRGATLSILNTGNCMEPLTVVSMPVTVKEPSRLYASAGGRYSQNGSTLNVVSLYIELRDTAGSLVALSQEVVLSAAYGGPGAPDNGDVVGGVEGVLFAGSAPFVASPGSYVLKLMLRPASSPCPAQSFFDRSSLSYQLAATAP